jgi:hypothetical protein
MVDEGKAARLPHIEIIKGSQSALLAYFCFDCSSTREGNEAFF